MLNYEEIATSDILFQAGEKIGEARGEKIGEARGEKIGEKIGEARAEAKVQKVFAFRMFDKGMDNQMISEILNISLKKVQDLKKEWKNKK